ncbi:MAG: hypothetical protein JKY62_05920 [Desulfocapsa sp.]|nr:hypothetical protein [Desulfocapsa sp.]
MYKSQKEVEVLEQQLQDAATVVKKEELKDQLCQAKAELEQIRKVMEGRKAQSRASQHTQRSIF